MSLCCPDPITCALLGQWGEGTEVWGVLRRPQCFGWALAS